MKKLFLFCCAACLYGVSSAQKVYFLYLQSDDQTPFYVRIGDKIHSSASSGYLVLPNLKDSTYNFGLGFAKSTSSEAKFSVTIDQNDKGYIIKNFEDGLSLFDIQNLSLVKANAAPKDNTVYETKTDRFSSILSKAANDPGLLKVPVAKLGDPAAAKPAEKEVITVKNEEAKLEEQTAPASVAITETDSSKLVSQANADVAKLSPVKKDDSVAVTEMDQNTLQQGDSLATNPQQQEELKAGETEHVVVAETPVFTPSAVSRYSESSTTEGFGIVYFDKTETRTDTIRILIPAPKVALVAQAEPAADTTAPLAFERVGEVSQEKKVETETADNSQSAVASIASSTNCRNLAADKDFLKLRKKMAGKENDEAMLDEARKEFKTKCYTVEQVRYLSTLFLTSASKYQFFDLAYNYVADKVNFASLGSEIKDDHYTRRFKAIIGE